MDRLSDNEKMPDVPDSTITRGQARELQDTLSDFKTDLLIRELAIRLREEGRMLTIVCVSCNNPIGHSPRCPRLT